MSACLHVCICVRTESHYHLLHGQPVSGCPAKCHRLNVLDVEKAAAETRDKTTHTQTHTQIVSV